MVLCGMLNIQGREITAASVKLAECQETILNLGKQLKVLASSQDAVLFDKVFSNSSAAAINRRVNKRLSLHDQLLADDGGKATDINSPKIQEAEDSTLPDSSNCKKLQASGFLLHKSEVHRGSRRECTNAGVMALAIVPSKKQGVGLLRRLLFRRRKSYSKKPHYQN
ncbi:Detected protein of unknown function [Hibiscus syriacus]|uniref:Uncharacterized protein n=1 Tax=Hibiscus syriacus TaxID=106335 RepID=A0A6A3C163_HIBSY|nr:Detected protein of unknown function [Hibiscus syriacus]